MFYISNDENEETDIPRQGDLESFIACDIGRETS